MPSDEIRLQGAPNFRDLGGVRTPDGRQVRHGRVFRSEVLIGLLPEDRRALHRLGIAAVCDLRHGLERERSLDCWPSESVPQQIGEAPAQSIEAVQPGHLQRRVLEADFDPAEARAALMAGYRLMPKALAPSVRRVFQQLAQPSPLLIHCTSGKDRSGFVCALILTALGVRRDDILHDYLLSRERVPTEHIRQMLSRALGKQLPPGRMETLLQLATVDADYLDAAFDQIKSDYGGLDAYLEQIAGLDAPARHHLQSQILCW